MELKSFKDWLKEEHKMSEEQLMEKEAKEQADYYNKYTAHLREKMETAVKEKADKKDIEEIQTELSKSITKEVNKINEILKTQGDVLRNMAVQGSSKAKSLKEQLIEQQSKIEKFVKGESEGRTLKLKLKGDIFKSPVDMTRASTVGSDEIPQATRLPGVDNIRQRQIRLTDVVTRGTITGPYVQYVSQSGEEGGAAATAEGDTKSKYSTTYEVVQHNVKKITALSRITDEMLNDVSWLESEIRNTLSKEVLRKLEDDAWDGDGNGATLEGYFPEMPAFAPGAFADEIDNPNEVDVLTAAINQIHVDSKGTAVPNVIMMHPTDVTKQLLTKVSENDRRYIGRLTTFAGQLMLDGIPIVKTILVDQGTAAVGDFSLAMLMQREGVEVEIGLGTGDFEENYKTLRAEGRFVSFIRNNDKVGFVKIENFATAIDALDAATT